MFFRYEEFYVTMKLEQTECFFRYEEFYVTMKLEQTECFLGMKNSM